MEEKVVIKDYRCSGYDIVKVTNGSETFYRAVRDIPGLRTSRSFDTMRQAKRFIRER